MAGLQPFAFGHPFRQGDVPAGSVALGDSTDWQCTPLTYWPDGSLKHAIVAGRASVTVGVDTVISLSAGPSPGAAALTEANLASALPTTTIAIDGDVTTLNSLVGTGALQTTVCVGPVMSSWIYRRSITGNSHLVAYVEVRLFKGGAVEIFPWVENGYLAVAGPSNFVRTCTVTIGGVQRFSQSIDIKHHTRVPLVSGSLFSYWTGTDPGIAPKHDCSYILATKLVPNISFGAPSSTTLNALTRTYTPNTLAGDSVADGGAGGSGGVISGPSALYLTSSGDARAYLAMMVHGLSSGSWSLHYRDEGTNRPFAFSSFPLASVADNSTPVIPGATGGQNANGPAMSHVVSYAYFPFLVTGRWWFLDELHFWATYAYLKVSPTYREQSKGAFVTGQPRIRAWSLNVLAQAATITPATHPLQSEFVASWQWNTDRFRRYYVDGATYYGGNWVSPQGYMGDYTGNSDLSSVYVPEFTRTGTGSQTDFETYGTRDISTYSVLIDGVQKVRGTDWSVSGTRIVFASPPAIGAQILVRGNANQWWTAPWMHDYVSVVFGTAGDLGIPQSAQSLADYGVVRDHAYKVQIERAGDGLAGRPNWRHFTQYMHPLGTDKFQLPLESYYTSEQAYAAYMAELGLPALDAQAGGTLKYGNADIADGSSGRAYLAPALAALALAVEQRVAGAEAAYLRIKSASNYASALTNYLTNERPEWGILPR